MIRNEKEYAITKQLIANADLALAAQRTSLEAVGIEPDGVQRALEPVEAIRLGLLEDLAWYERVRGGDLDVLTGISQIGVLLIAARIAAGISQRDLAERLGVSEAQVSRDERNDYHGITVERAQRVMDVLGGAVTVRYEGSPRVA